MIRYSVITADCGTTVISLRDKLTELIQQGAGDSPVKSFDADSEKPETVTGLTYGEGVVQLYTDLP